MSEKYLYGPGQHNPIFDGDYLTDQETYLLGGSPIVTPDEPEFYIPRALIREPGLTPAIRRRLTRKINEIRLEAKYYLCPVVGSALGFHGRLSRAVITLEPLDLRSFQTIKDPQVTGILDEVSLDIITFPERDLTREMVEAFIRTGADPKYRLNTQL